MGVDLDYAPAGVPIRQDLQEAHRAILEHLRAPGAWLTGAQRMAVAAESRNAVECALCVDRKEALSPEQVQGEHATLGALPATQVEIVHRVRTDSGRLSRRFFDQTLQAGIAPEAYVEIVGIVTLLAGLDTFCRATGVPPFRLPDPLPGEPSRHRPAGTRDDVAWVPILMPEDASGPEADLYPRDVMVPNIAKALSLVPDHARLLRRLAATHYLSIEDMTNPTLGRDLDRLQIELVAARVSALNECFY